MNVRRERRTILRLFRGDRAENVGFCKRAKQAESSEAAQCMIRINIFQLDPCPVDISGGTRALKAPVARSLAVCAARDDKGGRWGSLWGRSLKFIDTPASTRATEIFRTDVPKNSNLTPTLAFRLALGVRCLLLFPSNARPGGDGKKLERSGRPSAFLDSQ